MTGNSDRMTMLVGEITASAEDEGMCGRTTWMKVDTPCSRGHNGMELLPTA